MVDSIKKQEQKQMMDVKKIFSFLVTLYQL